MILNDLEAGTFGCRCFECFECFLISWPSICLGQDTPEKEIFNLNESFIPA